MVDMHEETQAKKQTVMEHKKFSITSILSSTQADGVFVFVKIKVGQSLLPQGLS